MRHSLAELKEQQSKLVYLIDEATRKEDDLQAIELKKSLYKLKLEMLEILSITQTRSGVSARQLRQVVENRPKVPRYATGITALDFKLFGGIEIGTFIQLAGESGVGKTHLQLEILSNIANYSKAVFFNFEMGDTRIIKRLEKLMFNEQQWDNLIIDNDSRDIDTLCNEITLYARDGIKFFTIDSKMKLDAKGELQDYQKFSMISKRLAELAQKQEVIIFLINQMNEDDIKNKRLAFKGSGDQKYDADIALFYIKDKDGNRKLICNKNRQDEVEFFINFHLEDGKTVADNIQTIYKNNEGRAISKPTVTEYIPDKVEATVI
jgi:replicative DNA helicase